MSRVGRRGWDELSSTGVCSLPRVRPAARGKLLSGSGSSLVLCDGLAGGMGWGGRLLREGPNKHSWLVHCCAAEMSTMLESKYTVIKIK